MTDFLENKNVQAVRKSTIELFVWFLESVIACLFFFAFLYFKIRRRTYEIIRLFLLKIG